MDILRPLTVFVEWIWCAAQVGATYVEMCLVVTMIFAVLAVGWHGYRWNKKLLLTLHAMQNQLETNTDSVRSLQNQLELNTEGIRTLKLDAQNQPTAVPPNSETSDGEIHKLITKLAEEVHTLRNETGIIKKRLLEVLSLLGTLKTISLEVSGFHKLLEKVVTDCGKLGGFYNRVTETHTLVLQLPTQQQHEGNLIKMQKGLEEYVDKMQKLLTSKLDEVSEKTAVLRVVMDQKHEKQTSLYKELHGGTYSDIRNLIALVRGLGPVVPELKKVVELVTSGREASNHAQQTLQSTSETMGQCEDRLIRLESMTCGLVDQSNECETKVSQGVESVLSEMPILHEILGRLPKLPQRKPPKDGPAETQSASTSGSAGSTQSVPQPTTPPTTLGPQPTVPLQMSNPVQPTIIPVSLDTSTPGIQLRLAEHLTPQQSLNHVFQASDGRTQPNILITQLPAQPNAGGNLLSALLQNQR
eukprot:s433_g16.t1